MMINNCGCLVISASAGFAVASVTEDSSRELFKSTNLVQEILDVLLVCLSYFLPSLK